ncbi:MAG: hypothetical protein EXR57_01835 [Dehalococcoidia bacterium]|nr:hypothetical protein [Dehalococcoidia bacterium]MSQ34544.1 hypothetical protein [Dehalococcoidia bacterium]
MTGSDSRLVLQTGSPRLYVSAFSSLLRTFQAAVRDVGSTTETGKRLLAAQPPPVLEVRVEPAGAGMTLSFSFTGPDLAVLDELNAAAFGGFMSELAAALKITPQRTLWGTPVRPLVRSAPENERLRLFLDDFVRLGDVTVSAGGRKITVSGGRAEAVED